MTTNTNASATLLATFAMGLIARGEGASLRIDATEWAQIIGEWLGDARVTDTDLLTLATYAGQEAAAVRLMEACWA